ncbi:hypothetical protein AK830_g6718 [Neonectria ditissima]|uniref:Reverse transcriptase domain-containing protein n=1 Tax=Neonectria ditissima TaxID=78410 RepID=A0A0P7APV2_9HYPO|nr:hypothetical protein AK830_g6718 [Neonectria ditissima]
MAHQCRRLSRLFPSLVVWLLVAQVQISGVLSKPTPAQRAAKSILADASRAVPDYVTRYAPLVWLHSDDAFRPSDLLDHVRRTTPMVNQKPVPGLPDLDLDNLALLNDVDVEAGQVVALTSNDDVTDLPAWLFGETPDESGRILNATPCVVVAVERGPRDVDAFFFYFYSYDQGANISQVLEPLNGLAGGMADGMHYGNHVGDWEHNMVRFRDGEPTGIYYSQHSSGAAYSWNDTGLSLRDGRPLVFSAYGSHANYASSGDHVHDKVLLDYCDAGQLWDPVLSAYFYHMDPTSFALTRLSPSGATTPPDSNLRSFFYFTGIWGDAEYPGDHDGQKTVPVFGLKRYVSGPQGPIWKQLVRKGLFPDDPEPKQFVQWAVGVFMSCEHAALHTPPQPQALELSKVLRLLKKIAQGIPDWIVLWVWSFLSDRSIVVRMPGYTGEKCWVNIGIPQGSPLSPLLFLFFAAPILEILVMKHSVDDGIFAFAYIDDTYILVTSQDYEHNSEKKDSKVVPQIPEFLNRKEPWKQPKEVMTILGVQVDYRLKWDLHIEMIRAKVRTRLRRLQRICGYIWGPPLASMRQFYMTKIRPVFFYACGAWFMHLEDAHLPRGLGQKYLGILTSLQYECLLQVSGAMAKTSRMVLEKELNIESIDVFLNRLAIIHRARALSDPGYGVMDLIANPTFLSLSKSHPYNALQKVAKEVELEARAKFSQHQGGVDQSGKGKRTWSDPIARRNAIRACCKRRGQAICAERWKKYQESHAKKTQALVEGWGPSSFGYYKNLTRVQSTMLLHCRTEVIGLNAYLSSISTKKSPLAESPNCPSPRCRGRAHTVHHLFVYCRELIAARVFLIQKLGHTDIKLLLTKDAAIAADWAITFFRIPQFDHVQEASIFHQYRDLDWYKKESQFEHPKKHPHSLYEGT